MKKELSPQQMIAIVAVFVVVVVAVGWMWINYNPTFPESAGTPGANSTMPAAGPGGGKPGPTGTNGSQGNQPMTPDV